MSNGSTSTDSSMSNPNRRSRGARADRN
jgi:hypothetical protein